MKFYAERMKMIVEPTGCLSLAGMINETLNNKIDIKNKKIGIIISGGNIDLEKFSKLI